MSNGLNQYLLGEYYISDGIKPVMTKVRSPVVWTPLERCSDGSTLVLSRNVLDWELYDFGFDAWKGSFIYEQIQEMYENMFTPEEKDAIITKELGPLFLLSEEEIVKYLPTNADRRAVEYFVNYDKDSQEMRIKAEHYWYWLRKTDDDSDGFPFVTSLGEIKEADGESDEIGIRLAMYINEKKARILSAKNGFNEWHHDWEYDEF